jgi:hypothetical protein
MRATGRRRTEIPLRNVFQDEEPEDRRFSPRKPAPGRHAGEGGAVKIKRKEYAIRAEIGLVLEAIAEERERWIEGLVKRLVKLEMELKKTKEVSK